MDKVPTHKQLDMSAITTRLRLDSCIVAFLSRCVGAPFWIPAYWSDFPWLYLFEPRRTWDWRPPEPQLNDDEFAPGAPRQNSEIWVPEEFRAEKKQVSQTVLSVGNLIPKNGKWLQICASNTERSGWCRFRRHLCAVFIGTTTFLYENISRFTGWCSWIWYNIQSAKAESTSSQFDELANVALRPLVTQRRQAW